MKGSSFRHEMESPRSGPRDKDITTSKAHDRLKIKIIDHFSLWCHSVGRGQKTSLTTTRRTSPLVTVVSFFMFKAYDSAFKHKEERTTVFKSGSGSRL